MAICTDGWNNWRGAEKFMFFLRGHPAGQSAFVDFDLFKVMMGLA
jgi:hypothetical protein